MITTELNGDCFRTDEVMRYINAMEQTCADKQATIDLLTEECAGFSKSKHHFMKECADKQAEIDEANQLAQEWCNTATDKQIELNQLTKQYEELKARADKMYCALSLYNICADQTDDENHFAHKLQDTGFHELKNEALAEYESIDNGK